jgi:RimJ/RimL family protein N-acetyltransferase
VKLTAVKNKDKRFLFNLLKEREGFQNISHLTMPTYSQHCNFVEHNPYRCWWVVSDGVKRVGACYLTDGSNWGMIGHEVGIFIKKAFRGKKHGTKVLAAIEKKCKSLNIKKIYANINPLNFVSIKFFQKRGFKILQYTYERDLK